MLLWGPWSPTAARTLSLPCPQLPPGSISLILEPEMAPSSEIKHWSRAAARAAAGPMSRRKRRDRACHARSTWLVKGQGDPGDSLTGVLAVWSSDFIYIFFLFAETEEAPRRDLMYRALFPSPACFMVFFLTSVGKCWLFSGNDCIYYARLRKWGNNSMRNVLE